MSKQQSKAEEAAREIEELWIKDPAGIINYLPTDWFMGGVKWTIEQAQKMAERVVYITDWHDNEMRGRAVRLADLEKLVEEK